MKDMAVNPSFSFKNFTLSQDRCSMKAGEDGILLASWSCQHTKSKSVLDIGAGSGVISLIIAQNLEDARIQAVEVDQGSFEDCIENFTNSPWSDRLNCSQILIQDFANSHAGEFDLIVCNPPFFSGGTLSYIADKDTIRSTIKLSHSDLLRCTKRLLSKDGQFCVILPLIEGLRFTELAETSGLRLKHKTFVKRTADHGASRLLLNFILAEEVVTEDDLILYTGNNEPTPSFAKLTSHILAH